MSALTAAEHEAADATHDTDAARERLLRWQERAPIPSLTLPPPQVVASPRPSFWSILSALLQGGRPAAAQGAVVQDMSGHQPPAAPEDVPLSVGSCVERRASGWSFGNQDGGPGCRGTIVMLDPSNAEWFRVLWDETKSASRYPASALAAAKPDGPLPDMIASTSLLQSIAFTFGGVQATTHISGSANGHAELVTALLQGSCGLLPPPRLEVGAPSFSTLHYQVTLKRVFPLMALPDTVLQYILSLLPGSQIAYSAMLCRMIRSQVPAAVALRLTSLGQQLPALHPGEPTSAALQFVLATREQESTSRTISCGKFTSWSIDSAGRPFHWGHEVGSETPDDMDWFAALGLTWGLLSRFALRPRLLVGGASLQVRHIAAGENHALLLTTTGQVYSWGEGKDSQLGHGDNSDRQTPALVSNLATYRTILVGCGDTYSIVLLASHRLMSFGSGAALGLGRSANEGSVSLPSRIMLNWLNGEKLEGICTFGAGPKHVVAIHSNGTCLSWGVGDWGGRLGHGSTANVHQPKVITLTEADANLGKDSSTTLRSFKMACAAERHSLALTKDGALYGWGNGCDKQLASESGIVDRPRLIELPQLSIRSVGAGEDFTVLLTTSGEVYTCGGGGGESGLLGYEADSEMQGSEQSRYMGRGRTQPQRLEALAHLPAVAIAVGGRHTLVRMQDGAIYAFGHNKQGQLGQGDRKFVSKLPVQVTF